LVNKWCTLAHELFVCQIPTHISVKLGDLRSQTTERRLYKIGWGGGREGEGEK